MKQAILKLKKKYLHTAGFVITLSLLFMHGLKAEVTLPHILSDNMVLQRDIPLNIWGWAKPGERVTVAIQGQKASVKTSSNGEWKVKLRAIPAGGPFEMTIQGKNILVLKNILIGDVWVCSGQSNMEFPLSESRNWSADKSTLSNSQIRLFYVPQTMSTKPLQNTKESKWESCDEKSAAAFSAVGYYFGANLNKQLGVPVGLINSNWGGTIIETWTSLETMYPDKVGLNLSTARELSDPNSFPSLLYNGMINPLINFPIKGAIWYQGEGNADNYVKYRSQLPALIHDWRNKWNIGDFTFLIVQLANYMEPKATPQESNWAGLREAQTMTLKVPKTGMAVIIDIGEARDIHPKDKDDVGYRLSLAALKVAYDKNIVYSGPMYKSIEINGSNVTVEFDNIGSGLMATSKYGYINAFMVAGADHKFYWARALITPGNKVVVSSDEVSNPVAVRYAWADNPDDANLYNKEGLPASPFRTDNW